MKKILTTIVLATSVTICFAQWQQSPQRSGGPNPYPANSPTGGNYSRSSSLVVSSASQNQFSVSVDNNQYQSSGNNNTVNIGPLYSGNHNIVIYEWKKNFWGKQVQKTVYNSSLNLKQGFETFVFLNSNGQVNISERQLYNSNNNTRDGYGNNGNGVGYGYGRDKNKHKKKHTHYDDDDRDYRKGDRDWDDRD